MEFSRPEDGVGSLSLLQGILPTQKLNLSLLHCRWILYQLSHQRNPKLCELSHITKNCWVGDIYRINTNNNSTTKILWAPREPFLWETFLDPSEWAYGPIKPWAYLYGITYCVIYLLSHYLFCFYLQILFLVNYWLTERIMIFVVWKPRKASELHKRSASIYEIKQTSFSDKLFYILCL